MAITRSFTVTLHDLTNPLESLVHSSLASLPLTSLRDSTVSMHMLSLQTVLRHCVNFSLHGTSRFHKYLLPPCIHHRRLQNGTEPSGTTGGESAARVQLPSCHSSVVLAISKTPLALFFWCVDKYTETLPNGSLERSDVSSGLL